jgi:uncharacterized protein (DUF2062 family)
MKGRLGIALRVLVQVEDSPHRTALSFAIGVWIAFCPLIGIHTGLALAVAFLFRLGRAPMLLGAYINNPWTLAPLYMSGTLLGCALLGVPPDGLSAIDWSLHGTAFYRTLLEHLRPYVWPYVLGNTLLGTLSGMAAYVVLRRVLERRRGAVPAAV